MLLLKDFYVYFSYYYLVLSGSLLQLTVALGLH